MESILHSFKLELINAQIDESISISFFSALSAAAGLNFTFHSVHSIAVCLLIKQFQTLEIVFRKSEMNLFAVE